MASELRGVRLTVVTACIAACGLLTTRASAAEGPARALPDFVNWSYDGAYQTHNGLRSSVVLNGWWRWMHCYGDYGAKPPADAAKWFYRKVPGYGPCYRILRADGKDTSSQDMPGVPGDKVQGLPYSMAWVEREFTIPGDWKDRDVEVVFENNLGESEV